MKKILFFFWLIASFIFIQSLWGISSTDFDSIVDFSVTLEELSEALDKNDIDQINKNKFVILNGTAAVIRPEKSFFFLLNPEDIINPSAFINTFNKKSDTLSQFLFNTFSPEIQEEIRVYKNLSENEGELLKNITNNLKKIFRRIPLYEKDRFAGISLSKELIDFAQRDLGTEEMAFVNRLLMEAAYPSIIKKVTVQVEIVYGTWIGYDEVKSYKSVIEFKGAECFKIFKRQKPDAASREMIPANSTILIVAKILGTFTIKQGEKGWLMEGLYIRGIQ